MLEDSDSGSDIEILDETNSSVVQPNKVSNDLVDDDDINEFNLPPGIILMGFSSGRSKHVFSYGVCMSCMQIVAQPKE